MARKILVIGGGAAGMTAASTARENGYDDIVLLTEDRYVAYSPCAIPFVIEGKIPSFKDIVMHTPEWYLEKRNIRVETDMSVVDVDTDAKKVTTADGQMFEYDVLVIATGGSVFVPPIEGRDLPGVYPVRWITDGERILDALPTVKQVVVAGAGVIGLEMAVALRHLGKDVTVIEMFDQVVPRILDGDMASKVQNECESMGIKFKLSSPLTRIAGQGKVGSVQAGGEEIPCQMVIMATGVRANLKIPNQMGLDIGPLGAVRVSPTLQPYRKGRLVKDIYLAGDVIMCESSVVDGPTMSQLGSSALRQGKVAGINASGGHATYPGTASPFISVVGGIQVGGTGLSTALAEYYGLRTVSITLDSMSRARYYPGGKVMIVKLIADRENGRLIGAQIVGGEDVNGRINWLTMAITERLTVSDLVNRMENAYCPPTSMVADPVVQAMERLKDALSKDR